MKTLALEIRFAAGRLEIAMPDGTGRTETGEADLEFDIATGLPAVLKALNALAYNPSDFRDVEREFLQDRQMLLSDGESNAHFAPDLRERVGARLFDILFATEPMRRIFENAYRSPGAVHYALTFNGEATVVGDLPWELLYHDNDFLIGGGRGSLSRHLAYGRKEYARPTLSVSELNVLLITPRPPSLQGLDQADAEALAAIDGLHIERLAAETNDAFADYVRSHAGAAPHVIHFDGHGAYGKRCWTCRYVSPMRSETCINPACPRSQLEAQAQGYLAWEHPRFGLEMVSATAFANQIGFVSRGERSDLRLIVASACRSGSSTGGSAFSGIAQRLIKASVPALVAMQFEVRADTATQFADSLYRSLVQNDSLIDAVAYARTMIDGLDDDQWYRPVLYFAAAPEVSEGRLFQFGRVGPDFNPDAPDKALVEQSRLGLVRAGKLASSQPDLRRKVLDARDDFDQVVRKLDLMNYYKKIHDELHEVYLRTYMSMRANVESFDEDATVRAGFVGYEQDAQTRFSKLRVLTNAKVCGVDDKAVEWVDDLAGIDAQLLKGIRSSSRQLVNKAVRDLGSIVSLQPSRINGLLVQAERELRLEEVIAILRVNSADDVMSAGADALDVLRTRLDALVTQHDEWQDFEPYLRQLEPKDNLEWFVEDWPDRRNKLEKLCASRCDAEVGALREAWAAVDTAIGHLGEQPWPATDEQRSKERAVRETFAACAFQTSMHFYAVDMALNAMCDAFVPLSGPLKDLKAQETEAA